MNSLIVFIKEPQTPIEFEAYYLLRYELLRKPWKKEKGSEKDEIENECRHLMATDENGNIIGVCRLQFNSNTEAQIRYMAVSESYQGLGVGKKLIAYAEIIAKERGNKEIVLQSRSSAVNFYKKCGYTLIEESYLMWGEIQHYLMKKTIIN